MPPGWGVPGLTPSLVNETNYLDLEERANRRLMHPPPLPMPAPLDNFKFHPGDWVVEKRTRRQPFKDKVALTGYDLEEPRREIKLCSYRLSGGDGNRHFRPFYQLDTELWVPETDIALRQCPHQRPATTTNTVVEV